MAVTETFKAADNVEITADVYQKYNKSAPFIVLFHQAGTSRGEYDEIAPRLNTLGFNCMAIDQRSGDTFNGKSNATNLSAKKMAKGTDYIDTIADIKAAVNYAKAKYSDDNIILWGSSYSAALVILLNGLNQIEADGLLSFSPGEYLGSENNVAFSCHSISVPIFITSAKNEKSNWWNIYESISSEQKRFFLPVTGDGRHGSSALFATEKTSEEYWEAVESFLKEFFLKPQ